MSSKLIAGTATSGAALSADTTGILEIQTGSTPTTAITVDASQNLGIGISPNASVKLQVKTATNQDFAVVPSSFVTGGITLAGVNDAYNAYVPVDISASTIQFGTGGLERMRIDSSGNVLVGTTSANFGPKFAVSTGAADATTIQFNGNYTGMHIVNSANTSYTAIKFWNNGVAGTVGNISCTTTATTYTTSSDYRLKENIAPMSGALDKIVLLKPCTYTWKSDGSEGQGFIAHELQAVVPDCVTGEKDAVNEDGTIKPQSIDTSFLVATLTAALQELKAIVDTQAAEIQALKGAA